MSSQLLPINPDTIGFFFGAGASIEFGIPSMKQMTKSFAEKIRSRGKPAEKKLFHTIYKSLTHEYAEDNLDLEAIMSVIVELKEKNRLKDNIGELGLFVLAKEGITNISDYHYERSTLDSLEAKYKKHVRSNVVIKGSRKIDRSRIVYFDFFRKICSVSVCDNIGSPDTDSWKYTHGKWTFFTTNYDNIIEDFWVSERDYTNLDLGFRQPDHRKVMDADRFLYSNTVGSKISHAMQLVKLHGSINWIRNKNNQIEEHSYHLTLDNVRSMSGTRDISEDILIYPLSRKQLYVTPFIQLFSILNAELSKREYWIVIGYSFRDIIIRTMFERALSENKKRKLLLIHPHASQSIRPLFQEDVQEQIKCLDRHFGKRNYPIVNEEISKALLSLSDERRA
jgi:SIR2-like domain